MKNLVSILSCILLLSSCTKYEMDSFVGNNSDEEAIATRSLPVEVNFKKLANPYALDVMQSIYEENASPVILEPTDLYVRFLPKDSVQLNSLYCDYNLELFDYPLDIEIPEDAIYMDPTIPEGDFTWLYTTVSPNFVFPKGITYEIIEECYIPEEDETIVVTRAGTAINVEKEAFRKLGYTIDEEPETRAIRRPSGTICVYDDVSTSYTPVKGVKIRCHTIVKWSTTYTNENGDYIMDSKFVVGPHYAVVFDNCKGFDIWGNWGPIARANLNLGWHSNKGYSRDIKAGSFAWDWAAANNAGYDYYKMCEETGISLPPKDLKMWVFKDWKSSSAPMLRRIVHPIGTDGIKWGDYFIRIEPETALIKIVAMLRHLLPDITIGTSGKDYRGVYSHVNHELAHASHFSTVGSAYWAQYINYIMAYGCYGDGTGKNAELCGVGEMWGYFMGHRQEYEKYAPSELNDEYPFGHGWIKPQVFWRLCSNDVLSKKEIYDCLAVGVATYDKLVEKMYEKYPTKVDSIERAFLDNGITPHVTKPIVNKTIYTGYCDVYLIYEWDRYNNEVTENYYLGIYSHNTPSNFNKTVKVELMLGNKSYSLNVKVNNTTNSYRKPYYPQPYHFYIDGGYPVDDSVTEDTYDIVPWIYPQIKIVKIDGFTDTALIDLDDTHQLKIQIRNFWDKPYPLWCADPYVY